jgi:hypothetical protein
LSFLRKKPLRLSYDQLDHIAKEIAEECLDEHEADHRTFPNTQFTLHLVRQLLEELDQEGKIKIDRDIVDQLPRRKSLGALVQNFAGEVRFEEPSRLDRHRLNAAAITTALVATLGTLWTIMVLVGLSLRPPFSMTPMSLTESASILSLPLLLIIVLNLRDRTARFEQVFRNSAILTEDQRRPIMFLRSFQADGERAPTGYTEEILSRHLGCYGPVVAIARPGEAVPMAGAVHLQVGDKVWQSFVLELAAASRLVVLRVGKTPGLMWELRALREPAYMERLVLYLGDAGLNMLGRDPKRFDAWVATQEEGIRQYLGNNLAWFVCFERTETGEFIGKDIYTGTDISSFSSATRLLAREKLLPYYEPSGVRYKRLAVADVTDMWLILLACSSTVVLVATIAYRIFRY